MTAKLASRWCLLLMIWLSPGGCGGPAGGGTDGSSAVAADPLSAAPTCTSKLTWLGGDEGSADMNPGMACVACHLTTTGQAPVFTIAGTIYPTGHEPDGCFGANGSTGAQVVITGADGNTLTLAPSAAGNFYSTAAVALPFQAKVLSMGRERAMLETQSTGDCNSCHTQSGANLAPGRIVLP